MRRAALILVVIVTVAALAHASETELSGAEGHPRGRLPLAVWTEPFNDTALARSVPKGFSMMMRQRSTRPASASRRTADKAAFGGTLI